MVSKWMLGLVCVALVAACSNNLTGTADVKTLESGPFSLAPDTCYSGEREAYFGVQLEDKKSGSMMRLVKDPVKGYTAVVRLPKSDKALTVTPEGCAKFDVHIETQSSTINNIRNIKGRADIDCISGENSLRANLTFENCH